MYGLGKQLAGRVFDQQRIWELCLWLRSSQSGGIGVSSRVLARTTSAKKLNTKFLRTNQRPSRISTRRLANLWCEVVVNSSPHPELRKNPM